MGFLDYIHTRNAPLTVVAAPVGIYTTMCRSQSRTLALKDNTLKDNTLSETGMSCQTSTIRE
jgi:hypothetical protein